ncbi:iron uptake porin [Hyella patelloides]|uniref:iron uptake porin n=1 Tax=Hyella patelloides TaxID=1982969 RepID=UPI001643D619|nr:iron uptake porin [Hyella patelloides]
MSSSVILLSLESNVLAISVTELPLENSINSTSFLEKYNQHGSKKLENITFFTSSNLSDLRNISNLDKNSLAQLTNVHQLRDVNPGDWAYEALRSLVDRYGCIAGFPNQTYRGNQALRRYEFAAGLNSCLNQIERLIASSEAVAVEDIKTVKRLTQEFETELKQLDTRVNNLENRIAALEDNQFSTTTKLYGEVVLALAGVVTGKNLDGDDIPQITTFSDRVRLDLETSFTGHDFLYVELEAGNTPYRFDYFEGALGFESDTENDVYLAWLAYYFPIGERTEVTLQGVYGTFYDYTDTVTVLDGDGGSGALSYFATRNPIYNTTFGAGAGIRHEFNDVLEITGGYLASQETVSNPTPGNGLFNGDFATLAQLLIKPNDDLKFGLTYVHGYNSETFTGSTLVNFRSFTADNFDETASINSDAFGVEFSWAISVRFVLGGWGAYTKINVLDGQFEDGSLDVWNGAIIFAFPDLIKEGSMGGIVIGIEPKVTNSEGINFSDRPNTDRDTSFHLEAFYQLQLTDNIAITPGLIWLTAPDHDNDNDDVVIGVIRTTFSF